MDNQGMFSRVLARFQEESSEALAKAVDPTFKYGLQGNSTVFMLPGFLRAMAAYSMAKAYEFCNVVPNVKQRTFSPAGSFTIDQPARLFSLGHIGYITGNILNPSGEFTFTKEVTIRIPGPDQATPNSPLTITNSYTSAFDLRDGDLLGFVGVNPFPIQNALIFGANMPAAGDGFNLNPNSIPFPLIGTEDANAAPYAPSLVIPQVTEIVYTFASANADLRLNFMEVTPDVMDSEKKFARFLNTLQA